MIVTGYRRQCEMHMPSLGILNLTHLLFGVQMYVAAVQEASGGGGGGRLTVVGKKVAVPHILALVVARNRVAGATHT